VAKLRVRIHELSDSMEEAVKSEEYLKVTHCMSKTIGVRSAFRCARSTCVSVGKKYFGSIEASVPDPYVFRPPGLVTSTGHYPHKNFLAKN
jgi:hypothetical protein